MQDAMLQKLADSEVRSALATRVSAWEKSIGVEIRREVHNNVLSNSNMPSLKRCQDFGNILPLPL